MRFPKVPFNLAGFQFEPSGRAHNQRHPKPGATCFRIASITWAL